MRQATRERLRNDVRLLSKVIGSRGAGTEQDDRALQVAKERFESAGLDVMVEEFPFMKFEAKKWQLSVDSHEIPSVPNLLSPSTAGTLHGRLADVGYGTADEIRNVNGKIILAKIGRVHESVKAETAAEKGALGAIFFATEDDRGIYTGRLRYPVGSIPSVCVSSGDGQRLSRLAESGRAVEMQVEGKMVKSAGKNLCAETEGADGEYLVLTAHRDSRPYSPGANDNASGTALMMNLASLLSKKRLRRGILFLSTDAEEYGLIGSLHHVRLHGNLLRRCVANLNLDSVGQGKLHVVEKDRAGSLSPGLNNFVIDVARSAGQKVLKVNTQNGSDCDAFMEAGVDSCWIRGWPASSFNGTADVYGRLDYALMEAALGLVTQVVEGLSSAEKWNSTIRSERC